MRSPNGVIVQVGERYFELRLIENNRTLKLDTRSQQISDLAQNIINTNLGKFGPGITLGENELFDNSDNVKNLKDSLLGRVVQIQNDGVLDIEPDEEIEGEYSSSNLDALVPGGEAVNINATPYGISKENNEMCRALEKLSPENFEVSKDKGGHGGTYKTKNPVNGVALFLKPMKPKGKPLDHTEATNYKIINAVDPNLADVIAKVYGEVEIAGQSYLIMKNARKNEKNKSLEQLADIKLAGKVEGLDNPIANLGEIKTTRGQDKPSYARMKKDAAKSPDFMIAHGMIRSWNYSNSSQLLLDSLKGVSANHLMMLIDELKKMKDAAASSPVAFIGASVILVKHLDGSVKPTLLDPAHMICKQNIGKNDKVYYGEGNEYMLQKQSNTRAFEAIIKVVQEAVWRVIDDKPHNFITEALHGVRLAIKEILPVSKKSMKVLLDNLISKWDPAILQEISDKEEKEKLSVGASLLSKKEFVDLIRVTKGKQWSEKLSDQVEENLKGFIRNKNDLTEEGELTWKHIKGKYSEENCKIPEIVLKNIVAQNLLDRMRSVQVKINNTELMDVKAEFDAIYKNVNDLNETMKIMSCMHQGLMESAGKLQGLFTLIGEEKISPKQEGNTIIEVTLHSDKTWEIQGVQNYKLDVDGRTTTLEIVVTVDSETSKVEITVSG